MQYIKPHAIDTEPLRIEDHIDFSDIINAKQFEQLKQLVNTKQDSETPGFSATPRKKNGHMDDSQNGFEFSQMKLNRSYSMEKSLEDDPLANNRRYGKRFFNDQRLGKESSESKRLEFYGNKIWNRFSKGDVHQRFFKPRPGIN